MSNYIDLSNSDITVASQEAVKFVKKDIENAFPLIIRKSFSLLDIPKILNVDDKEEEIERLQAVDAFLIDLEEQLKKDILASTEAILNNLKF